MKETNLNMSAEITRETARGDGEMGTLVKGNVRRKISRSLFQLSYQSGLTSKLGQVYEDIVQSSS